MYLRRVSRETSDHKYFVDLYNMDPCANYWLITTPLPVNEDSYGVEEIHRLVPDKEIKEFRVIPGK